MNKIYMYEGVHLLSVAATEIQNSEVLWQEDRTAVTVKSRDGTLDAATIVWNYVGEVIFNLLVLVGAIKMSDRLVRELLGLG